MPRLFRAFGLLIQSSFPIPGAQPVDTLEAPIDLYIEEAAIDPHSADGQQGPYRRVGDSLLFTMPAVARYLCMDSGKRLLVDSVAGASPEEVAAILIATALPAILWMRGEIVLHAAAAVLPGHTKAIAIAGASGSGKSTLLQSLVADGAVVVAEDTLRIRFDRSAVEVSGLPGCTFLRQPEQSDRRKLDIPPTRQRASAPLGAMLLLDSPTTEAPEPLPPLQALTALLRHRHRPAVPRILGAEASLLGPLASLARSFPICNYPCNPSSGGSTSLLLLPNMRGYLT